MILAKIDVKKILKQHLFVGAKGTYLDLCLKENKDGPDAYGNDGMIVQEVSKEAREAGERGPIIGNYKIKGQKPASAKKSSLPQRPLPDPDLDAPEDDIGF